VGRDPRSGARHLLAAAFLGALLSQPGHLVGYLGHYGWWGLAVESRGVHGYFPGVLSASAALIGAGLLLALLVIAATRVLLGRALGRRRLPGVPFAHLLLVLALVQLHVYAVQELFEQAAAGQAFSPGDLVSIAGWGLAGQLPVAVVAAAALAVLSSPLLGALARLRSTFVHASSPGFGLPALSPPIAPEPLPVRARSERFAMAGRRRGPPASSLR